MVTFQLKMELKSNLKNEGKRFRTITNEPGHTIWNKKYNIRIEESTIEKGEPNNNYKVGLW